MSPTTIRRDFNWTIVAKDVAGNEAEETDSAEVSGDELSLRIDTNRPKDDRGRDRHGLGHLRDDSRGEEAVSTRR